MTVTQIKANPPKEAPIMAPKGTPSLPPSVGDWSTATVSGALTLGGTAGESMGLTGVGAGADGAAVVGAGDVLGATGAAEGSWVVAATGTMTGADVLGAATGASVGAAVV